MMLDFIHLGDFFFSSWLAFFRRTNVGWKKCLLPSVSFQQFYSHFSGLFGTFWWDVQGSLLKVLFSLQKGGLLKGIFLCSPVTDLRGSVLFSLIKVGLVDCRGARQRRDRCKEVAEFALSPGAALRMQREGSKPVCLQAEKMVLRQVCLRHTFRKS